MTIRKRKFYHRGHNVELHDPVNNLYRIKMGGKVFVGTLWGVKQSIEWWCENRVIRPPSEFEKQDFSKPNSSKQIEQYRGVQIINDEGKEKSWYAIYKGQLLKGSLKAVKKFIEKN